jgi:FMN phosphatase YigB (HAD superfamily)
MTGGINLIDKLILFDWGNVLLNSHSNEYSIFDAREDIACELTPDNPESLAELFNNERFWTLSGENLNSLIQENLAKARCECTVSEFKRCYLKHYRTIPWFEETKNLVNKLSTDSRFHIGILSTLCEMDLELLKENLKIDMLDFRFFSFNIGQTKSDKKMYEIIEMVTGYKGKNILFVDDLEHNITLANEFKGWKTLLATGADFGKIRDNCFEFMGVNYKKECLRDSLIMDAILSFPD